MATTKKKTGDLPFAAAHGALRVWWIPRVPGTLFTVPVESVLEAKLLMNALTEYDLFLYAHGISEEEANAGGLNVFDTRDKTDGPAGSWVDWYSDDGEDIDHYTLEQLRERQPGWEDANA